MYWALILLIILAIYFAIQTIVKISFKKILSRFFPKLELVYGHSAFFSILKLVGENDVLDIEITNLQLRIDLFALFDLFPKSPFHLQFDKFHVNVKEDLAKIKKNKNKKDPKNISFRFWIFQKVIFFLTPLLIRKFSFNLNNIQFKIAKLDIKLKIKNITELFKISNNNVHNELRILSISTQLSNTTIAQIPEIRLSLNSDISILKILMVTAIKRLSFSIELLTVEFSNGLSSLNFKNVLFFMSSDSQVKCFIEIRPISIIFPIVSIDYKDLAIHFNNINGNLSKIKCSEISAINRDMQFVNIQQVSFSLRNLNISSINVELHYPLMLTIASLIQIVYKNEPKLPKMFKIPLNVDCNFVHFKIDLSDYHKIDMNFQKGFKLIGDSETYNINNNNDYSLQSNENNDLCVLIQIPKGTCATLDRDYNVYRPLMKISKAEVKVVSTKFYKIFAKSYDFFISPMFVYMPYFKVIGKCFTHLMSIIKGPDFVQFEDYPPTLIHFIFNIKTFRIIILKHELTAKISQSFDAKMSTISDLQLRLQKFFQIMRNNQVKDINAEEVYKTYREIRFKLYREAIRKIHDHDVENNNEKFATFVMKNVILDIDGFHFKSKKDIIKNLTEDEKYQSLKLTKESIGKINSVKLVIQMDTFDIFSNINTQFPQYEICKMRTIYYGIEFHFLDKKILSNRDYFLNELTLNGEKFIIPIPSSEPLLIYDKLVFTFHRFSFDFIPSFISYYQDSMIMISKIFTKLVPYPKINLFDNLRMRNVIYGSMKFTKLKLHLMSKPKSSLATITYYDLVWNFVNPLNHVFTFERFLINLKNKELFMSFPSIIMEAKLKIKNKNSVKNNEIVPHPFVEVDSVKMLERGYDPYEMARSQQIDFTIEMKFPKTEDKKQAKTTSKANNSIELNFDYLSTLIDKFLIKKKFVLEKVNHLFVKSVQKRNPVVQNYKLILPFFPPIDINFSNYTINVNISDIILDKCGEKNDFSFKSIEFWFLRMKNKHTGTLSLTDIAGTTFSNKNIYPSQYQIKKFRFEIYDKFLIHFFLKLASVMRNVLSSSAKAESYSGSNKSHSSLSLNTKAEEERRLKKKQKLIIDQKCTRLSPDISLSELYSIFQIPCLLVFLDEATIEFYHRSFSISPSISFNKLSLESRKSTKLSGGRMNIVKFEQFTAEILQKKGFPFIKAKEMELDVLLSLDLLFFTAQLKKGMDMNIQSDAISLTTNELFSNLPKIELIFNDENFIKFLDQRQQAHEDKKKEAEKKKRNALSFNDNSYINSSDHFNLAESDNDFTSTFTESNEANNNEILCFSKKFSLYITSNIEINLIDPGFNSIATLKSNKIAYNYVYKENMTETQNIVIGDLEVCNNTPSGVDKQTGELNRYYKFLKVIGNNNNSSNNNININNINNENKFLEMNILKNLNLMKLPFFSKVTIKIKPVEVNISREFVKILADNFKLFSKFNVFDFDKMKKYFVQMKQKSKSNADQEDEDDNEDSVAAAAAAAVSANPDENPYGFYGSVEVDDMTFKMSILNDNATIFKSIENRSLNIDKIVVTDLFATKERILKLVKKKITLDILKSIPTLFIGEKEKKS